MRAHVAGLAAFAALLLCAASPAAAAPRAVGPPTTSWSVSKIVQGAGEQVLGHDTTRTRTFFERFDLGRQGFVFPAPNISENADPQVQRARPRAASRT